MEVDEESINQNNNSARAFFSGLMPSLPSPPSWQIQNQEQHSVSRQFVDENRSITIEQALTSQRIQGDEHIAFSQVPSSILEINKNKKHRKKQEPLYQSQQGTSQVKQKKKPKSSSHNIFMSLLKNNMVSQSAAKARISKENTKKALFAQEQDHLKQVFGDDLIASKDTQSKQSQVEFAQPSIGSLKPPQSNSDVIRIHTNLTVSNGSHQKEDTYNNPYHYNNNNSHAKQSLFGGTIHNRLQQLPRNEKSRVFTFNQAAMSSSDLEVFDERNKKSQSNSKKHSTYSNEAPVPQYNSTTLLRYSITSKIMQFLYNLKVKSALKHPSLLNDYRLTAIGDLAFSSLDNCTAKYMPSRQQISNNQKSSQFANSLLLAHESTSQIVQMKPNVVSNRVMSSFYLWICHSLPEVDPSSKGKQVWDLFILAYIIAVVLLMPIDNFILYYTHADSVITDSYQIVYWLLLFIGIVDILSHFCIGIYHQGEIIRSHKAIAKAYLQGQFVLDLVSALPIVLRLIDYNSNSFADLLVFLKLYQIEKIFDQQYEYQITRFNKGHIVSIAKIIIIDLFVIHFVASLFLFIGFSEAEGGDGWIHAQGLSQASWLFIYSRTFYMVLQLHLTIGSQLIQPITQWEYWFLTAAQVLLVALLVRTVKKLSRILKNVKKQEDKVKKQMFWVNVYLQKKPNIDLRLKIKIVKYMQFLLNREDQQPVQQQEQRILAQLSPDLRDQILVQSNIEFIQKSKLLSSFALSTQEKICANLETVSFKENERVFEEGDFAQNPYYFFIKEGSVDFFVESFKGNQQILKLHHLEQGHWFGELSFLTLKERLTGVITSEKSEMICLSRSDFEDILRSSNQSDFMAFKLLESQLKLNEITLPRQNCWSCHSSQHTIKHCPLIHFVPDIEKIILQHNFSFSQMRRPKFPRKEKKLNTYSERRLVAQQQRRFKANNPHLFIDTFFSSSHDTTSKGLPSSIQPTPSPSPSLSPQVLPLLKQPFSNQSAAAAAAAADVAYATSRYSEDIMRPVAKNPKQHFFPQLSSNNYTSSSNNNNKNFNTYANHMITESPPSLQQFYQQQFSPTKIQRVFSLFSPPINRDEPPPSHTPIATSGVNPITRISQQDLLERRNSGSTIPINKSDMASIKSLIKRLSSKPPLNQTPPTTQKDNLTIESLSETIQKPQFNSNSSLNFLQTYPISPILNPTKTDRELAKKQQEQQQPQQHSPSISALSLASPPAHQHNRPSIKLDIPDMQSPPHLRPLIQLHRLPNEISSAESVSAPPSSPYFRMASYNNHHQIRESNQILKTFSSDRYANKVAAVQSQQISDLRLLSMNSKEIDIETFRKDGIHSPTFYFAPSLISVTEHDQDKSIAISQKSQKRSPIRPSHINHLSTTHGQGMYTIFNRKILLQQVQNRNASTSFTPGNHS